MDGLKELSELSQEVAKSFVIAVVSYLFPEPTPQLFNWIKFRTIFREPEDFQLLSLSLYRLSSVTVINCLSTPSSPTVELFQTAAVTPPARRLDVDAQVISNLLIAQAIVSHQDDFAARDHALCALSTTHNLFQNLALSFCQSNEFGLRASWFSQAVCSPSRLIAVVETIGAKPS